MKKVIWGILLIFLLAMISWFDMPYIIPTNNIISNQHIEYTYEKISIYNWYSMDSNNIEVTKEEDIKNIIEKIDNLKLRRTKILAYGNDSITFMARYKEGNGKTYVGDVFTIEFTKVQEDNILTLNKYGDSKSYTYKIMDKDFHIEAFIEELKSLAKGN